uniref:Uncharacterized protein n=1 Tax=Arundo donax TaxID=35708 RepID=A0A0A9EJB3_ARUDO
MPATSSGYAATPASHRIPQAKDAIFTREEGSLAGKDAEVAPKSGGLRRGREADKALGTKKPETLGTGAFGWSRRAGEAEETDGRGG